MAISRKNSNRDDSPSTESIFVYGDNEQPRHGLHQTLQPRHLSMIALGGVIGAGLLVASSTAIATTGPAVLISYALAGLVLILVMRMLGELSSANPDSGSFSAYAAKFIGPWAGTAIGWLYWWNWGVIVAIESTAAAKIIAGWVPGLPQWVPALGVTLLFVLINMVSVRAFGELEFWFASIKVGAIVAIIIVGALAVFRVIPNDTAAVSNLWAQEGGFMPEGPGAVLAALLTVVFSMFGAEVATIAAGESADPQHAVRKAVNTVVFRVLFFYIGSIFVVLLVVPWTDIKSGISPFVTMLNGLGLPWAGLAMDIIVLTALLSCLNAALYTSSRMAYSLAGRGEAPRVFRSVNKSGTPFVAILISSAVGFISVVLNYAMPDYIFQLLVNSTGTIAIFVWITIGVSQLRSRRLEKLEGAAPNPNVIRMWGYPYLTWIVIIALLLLLIYMAFSPVHRVEVGLGLIVGAVCITLGVLGQRRSGR